MPRSFRRSLSLLVGAHAAIVLGQVTLVGPTYVTPDLPRLAPGQVVTLAFVGFKSQFAQPLRASGPPLPTTLGGISITIRQFISPAEMPVPIFSIAQSACVDAAEPQCSVTTLLSVQIPFELFLPPAGSLAPVAPALLTITEGTSKYSPIRFLPSPDAIHIVNTCDTTASAGKEGCQPGVIHADGRPVTGENPAKAGETVSVFAFGLGRVTPAVPSGSATPAGTFTLEAPVSVRFAFGANLPPQRDPVSAPSRDSISPDQNPAGDNLLFAGLSPGSVGLYQLNMRIPTLPESLQTCGAGVASNMTITVVGRASFDGAGICVAP